MQYFPAVAKQPILLYLPLVQKKSFLFDSERDLLLSRPKQRYDKSPRDWLRVIAITSFCVSKNEKRPPHSSDISLQSHSPQQGLQDTKHNTLATFGPLHHHPLGISRVKN